MTLMNASLPLDYLIYNFLKTKREIAYPDLLQAVKAWYSDASESEVRRALMKLELNGLITVSSDKKSKYYIVIKQ
ncbi:hypothetical protein GCM10007981_11320 [Thermocladium modestius]|uniref:Uncharacterized protein n=1 Tax=Thermocladium modestius TaxID=62609 RepID=A0A830GTP6_9CREN|nr:hypothetical protein [Thermocladium modestius]GGP20996.1 hypothetical protein GCM10007981_11320 [Thermocladium modestius]